jgi:mannosyltransferase
MNNYQPNENQIWSFNRKPIKLALGLLILIGFLIRLYQLNSGLWLDEILTYTNYAKLPYLQIVTTFDSENQHFLYSILAHTSFLIFGESAWALRLPAVLFGVASLAAIYLFGLEIANPREAFFGAALLTFSYYHVWFSQDARGYTGLLFWTVFSSWLFLRGLANNRPKTWLFYAISAGLGIYTQLTMIFVVISHCTLVAFNLNSLKDRWKTIHLRQGTWLLIGFILIGIFAIVFTLLIFPRFSSVFLSTGQLVSHAWDIPVWVINEIIKALGIGITGIYLLGIGFLISILGLVDYWRRKPILLWLIALPLITSTMASIVLSHFIWPRFYFYLLGFGVFFLIRGIEIFSIWVGKILRISVRNSARLGTYLFAGLVLFSAMTVPSAYGPKQDYSGALNFVQANKGPDDGIVAIGLTEIPFHDYLHQDWQMVTTIDELNTSRDQHQRIWVVYTLESVLDTKYPELMNFIKQNIPTVKQFNGTLAGGEIYIGLLKPSK